MNNINFCGIKDIKITKKQYKKVGSYIGMTQEIKQGEKNYTEVKIYARLTDDAEGNHFTDFQNCLHNRALFNPKNSDKIVLHMRRFDVPDEFVSNSEFVLNDAPILLNDRNKLPLMTYLARITREPVQKPELSEVQKHYMNLVNKSIAQETVDYIENSV